MKKKIYLLFALLLTSCQKQMVNKTTTSSSSTSEIISEVVGKEERHLFSKPYKIYINPSVQYQNQYVNNLTNEGEEMAKIANLLVEILQEKTNLQVHCNCAIRGLSLSNSVKESNNLNVDYHFAIHSNAGGGVGSEMFTSTSSYQFGNQILNSLNQLLPYQTRGMKDGVRNSLYEIKNTKAPAALVEILFHDEISQAQYIIENEEAIATALASGMIAYFQEID